jgi:2-haloacid dehalogenase
MSAAEVTTGVSGVVVTFDLFSALIDSRSGAGLVLDRLADERRWAVDGHEVYDAWDRRHKAAQRECEDWVPYDVLARAALSDVYDELHLEGHAAKDLDRILASLPDWPLWGDVPTVLPDLARHHRVGLLSNVDDRHFRRTAAFPYVEPELAMTSERLRAYKPSPEIYRRAQATLGRMVHVASSARDVRGSLEAGIPVVRLRRPGHELDPAGPQPPSEVDGLSELPAAIRRSLGQE